MPPNDFVSPSKPEKQILTRKTIGGARVPPRQSVPFTVDHRPKTDTARINSTRQTPSVKLENSLAPRKDFIDLTGDDEYSSAEELETKRRSQLERFGSDRRNELLSGKAEQAQPHKPYYSDSTLRSTWRPVSMQTKPEETKAEVSDQAQKSKRGRPPSSVTPSTEPVQKRSRGRPTKDIYSSEEAKSLSYGTPRRVGRPPKQALSTEWRPQGKINVAATFEWMKIHSKHPLVKQLYSISPAITIVNEVDKHGPPNNFHIVEGYEYTTGTTPLDPNARYGCRCQNCETHACECLADCAEDDDRRPLGFPYATSGDRRGCLLDKYLDHRHVIYECNELCECGSRCQNKVVKKGRKVPLEIFKTQNRGWGLRCHESLRAGQFVEVYLGEIITDAEARRRERHAAKDSYLFTLDKFQRPDADASTLYVVDGEKRGSVARFINHCCDPNLRVFAVSFDRGDPRVYQLAFFAAEYIPAGAELTFDYLDRDGEDYEDELGNPIIPQGDRSGLKECHCGAPNCRKWLWQ